MDDDDQFGGRRLEKEMLDVAEKDVNLAATMIGVPETVLVDLYLTSDSLAIQTWSNEDVVKVNRFPA